MQTLIIGWLGTAVAFLILDGLWLGLIAKNFYANQLGRLMAEPIRVEFAILFYLIYVTGLWGLAGVQTLDAPSLFTTFVWGAAIGFIAYSTYDLSNLAATRGWPVPMAFVDMAWGTFASGTAVAAGRYAVLTFT
jgi:uncharacterized membrane protein